VAHPTKILGWPTTQCHSTASSCLCVPGSPDVSSTSIWTNTTAFSNGTYRDGVEVVRFTGRGCRAVDSTCFGRQRSACTQRSSYSDSCPACCRRCDDNRRCSLRIRPRLRNNANFLFILTVRSPILATYESRLR